jgi:hypothetical protein
MTLVGRLSNVEMSRFDRGVTSREASRVASRVASQEASTKADSGGRFVIVGDGKVAIEPLDPIRGDQLTRFGIGDNECDINVGPAIRAVGTDRSSQHSRF